MSYSHVYPRCCPESRPYKSDEKPSSGFGSGLGKFKLYEFFVFCVPIFFTFILLFIFYLFYLRPRRVNWSSIRMRTPPPHSDDTNVLEFSRVELGMRKELREMLPIIVYTESFSVRDTQCAVCLGDYQAEDRLQQMPACGHTFHIDCIDSWLSMHSTCPLCRLSLLSSHKSENESHDVLSHASSVAENNIPSLVRTPEACENTEAVQLSGLRDAEPKTVQNNSEEYASGSQCEDSTRELRDARIKNEVHEHTGGTSA